MQYIRGLHVWVTFIHQVIQLFNSLHDTHLDLVHPPPVSQLHKRDGRVTYFIKISNGQKFWWHECAEIYLNIFWFI